MEMLVSKVISHQRCRSPHQLNGIITASGFLTETIFLNTIRTVNDAMRRLATERLKRWSYSDCAFM
eukprot:scaffold28381_cov19-Prasinocladus_malaysianus.AAC.1